MKKIFRKEFAIGLSAIIALAILFFGINFLKGVNIFKAANYYYASYTNVMGLTESAPVTINGFKVGQVRSIEYEYDNPGHVLVEMSLDRKLKVPAGSKALLGVDILGTASIELELSDSTTNHEVGDRLIGETQSGLLDALSENIMPTIGDVVPRINLLLDNLNRIVGDSALVTSVRRLDAITANLQSTTQSLAATTSKLAPIATDVKDITGNVKVMSSDLAEASQRIKNLPVEQLMADLQTTTDNLKQLSSQLNDPNSSLGKLMSSPELYNNINVTVQNLDSLFVDIKKNPKRYINVKVF